MVQSITSTQNELVKHWYKLKHNHDYRFDQQRILIEGRHSISELTTLHPTMVIITTNRALIPSEVDSAQVYLVSEAVMSKLTGLLSPDGILAEVPLPLWNPLTDKKWLVALDGVSDPGNLGTLLRTAIALGWEGVYILENSCDPFNDKALRAAKGATFKLPIAYGSWESLLKIAKANNLEIVASDMDGESPEDLDPNVGKLLIVGNEGLGLSDKAQKHAKRVTIPMSGNMESLNVAVAGGIMMYALKGRKIHV